MDKTDDLFREYIRKAKSVTLDGADKCVFVLKGRKILFTALKDLLQNQDNFKQYGVVRGMERWDNLIDWEQELAAIDTYSNTGEFNSLMHVTTFTDGLYATNYYINMAAGDVSTKDGWGFKNNFDPRDRIRTMNGGRDMNSDTCIRELSTGPVLRNRAIISFLIMWCTR